LIYDVIPSLSPEFCNGVLVDAFNDAAVKAFHYADALLTISEAAKLDIIKLADTFGQKCPPVSVVPLGSTIDYFAEAHDGADGVAGTNSGGNPPSPAVARICAKPFVLSVGTVEVRKNHTYLFRIWKMLMEKHEDATPNLVFVGRRGWLVEDLFQQLEQTHYLNGKIIVLSDINDDDLNTLYRESSFTVFPSLYEGWGLPVGESLAHGKLCVASSTSSVPEVGGEFAIYVDPHNLREGYTRIESLILNPDEIRIREKKISEEYKPLTWGKATEGFMALISGISKDLESADQGVTTPTTGGLPVLTSGRHYRVGKVGGKGRRSGNRLAATAASTLETIVSSEALTSTNWYDVEDWGCWSKGAASRIAFAPESNQDSGFAIFLEVVLPPGDGASRCSVSLNGKHQGDWELSKDGKRGVIILETDLKQTRKEKSRQPEIVVDFDLGRDGGVVAGGRTLGLGLVSIFICRTDDLVSRVRYFEASQSNVVRL
jgi:hypothetical protein